MPRVTRFEPGANELEMRQLTTSLAFTTNPSTGGGTAEISCFGSGSIRPANIRDPIGQVVGHPYPTIGAPNPLQAPIDWDHLVLILVM